MKFNEKLIELRKKQGLSQEELGYKLNVTRQTVSKWELGQTTPEMDKLVEMGKLFNVSVDELVNETESAPAENTVIEDQTIRPENGKENKNKLIIIGILLVILICIIVKMVSGFSVGNKTTDKQSFFDRFFGLFDKVISQQENMIRQQENMMGNADDIFSNMQNMMGNMIGNASEQINIKSFNTALEMYKGSNSGIHVKSLLDEVVTINKTKETKVTVKYAETETQDTEVIINLKADIKDSSNYEVTFEYDEKGFIYEVNIKRVFSDFEKKSFNGSFEIFAGSKMGASVVSALDKIITSNKTEERIITVKYMETETQNEDEIKNIKHNIDKFGDYDLSYEYDADGFICKAIVEKV